MSKKILLDAGSGGRASQRLITDIFLRHLDNAHLGRMDDAALLPPVREKLAMSADSYTVSPLFFPGGGIGSLAVHGTVNDISMLGARPLWLACSFIIEEGLEYEALEKIACDMAAACDEAQVKIVTGDTKVVPKGACDKVFINTAGIGEIIANPVPSGHNARPGDAILLSGPVGNHGLAIMAAREDVSFLGDVRSDSAPLADMIQQLVKEVGEVHTLRDPTRGGLATTLVEIAEQSGVCMEIMESSLPVDAAVKDGCSFLGLDPLYLANEGKAICIVPDHLKEIALAALKKHKYGKNAAIIGQVTDAKPGKVILHTGIGGQRYLGMLEGAQLPRIC